MQSLGDGGLHADGDRLLAVVEVAEAADQLRLVERVRGDLHPPDRRHVAEEGHQLRRRRLDGARRRRAVVAGERDAGLHGDGVGGERPAEYGGRERLQQIRGPVC